MSLTYRSPQTFRSAFTYRGAPPPPTAESTSVPGRLAQRRHNMRQGGGVKRKGLQLDGDQKADRRRQLVVRKWEDT